MESYVLSQEEQAKNGFTHRIRVTHEDLTEATANTAQTIAIHTVAARDYVSDAAFNLVTAFKDASDAALNTTTIIVGDDGNDDRYIVSTELNENGTEIVAFGAASTARYAYTAANTVDAIFGSMADKSLSNIDTGEIDIFLKVSRLPDLA